VAANFQEWLQQGEALYQAALKEFHAIEAQLEDLETKLVAKQAEVNQIAQVIGKGPVEASRRMSTELVPAAEVIDMPSDRQVSGSSNASIARALTGKFGR
jgi:hypothetical protein